MIVLEGTRLYLRAWEYNAVLMMTALAELVRSKGGRVKPHEAFEVCDRSLRTKIELCERELDRLRQLSKVRPDSEACAQGIKSYEAEYKKLKSVNNGWRTVEQSTYISFVYEGFYYYYELDDNPLFPFHLIKARINADNKYPQTYCELSSKDWWTDELLSSFCSEETIKISAQRVFEMLVKAKPGDVYRETHRQRVPNTYNDGWHWETVSDPVKMIKVNF